MNDGEIDDMRKQIQRETEIDPMDGGIDVPDGGDGITRYPSDTTGALVAPDQMPDYEEPPKDGEDKKDDEDEDELDQSFIPVKKGKTK